MDGLERIVAEHKLFEGLGPEFVNLAAGCAKNVLFNADRYLFHADDPADWIYLIRSVEDLIMNKNWIGVTTEMSGAVREIRTGAPDVMKGFSALAQAALKAGALDAKTKELIALAISVATRCDACVGFHAEAAVKQGASRDEVMETMGMAIYMGAGPSVMYAAQAVEAFDQFTDQKARSAA